MVQSMNLNNLIAMISTSKPLMHAMGGNTSSTIMKNIWKVLVKNLNIIHQSELQTVKNNFLKESKEET